jgi:mannose/fructose/N-acetylgalactosamine-specific phosphotransferase system component IIB
LLAGVMPWPQITWERELYTMGVPPEMDVEFSTVEDAGRALERCAVSKERTIVLVGDVASLQAACDACELVRRVNVGGIHERAGRTRRLPYVFLTDEEAERLKSLAEGGIEISARDVPNTRPVPLSEFV